MSNLYTLAPDVLYNLHHPKWWDFGKPKDFWTVHQEFIKELIEKNELKPADTNTLPYNQAMEAMEMIAASGGTQRAAIKPRPFPGGMLIPHFHYKGEVYLVPETKWQEISMKFKEMFEKKLASVNRLSFQRVLTLSDTIDTM